MVESTTNKLGQPHLMVQDAKTVDPSKLTALTPEVISRQATINVGTIGHVAHGKSTVVKAISGVQTVRFKNELERNITIKLGYANAKIYKAEIPSIIPSSTTAATAATTAAPTTATDDDDANEEKEEGEEIPTVIIPGSRPSHPMYTSRGSSHADTFTDPITNITYHLRRHISFVDCPGHDILMATMLNGAAVMDGALLLVDLVKMDAALAQQEQIRKFVVGTVADSAPILPISAVLRYNVDLVCEYLVHKIPVPVRDFTSVPRLIVIRSFDVNKPGQDVSSLQGGVAGGSILQGVLRVGDEIEVRPGIVTKKEVATAEGPSTVLVCSPIYSRISSLYAESNDLQYAVPGGLIGVGTRIDPTLTRADRLVGQVLGLRGKLPEVFAEIEISYYLLRRLLGVKTSDGGKQAKVQKLAKGEILMVNIGSTGTGGKVESAKTYAKISLTQPVCTQEGEKIALSRRVDKHWRLIGWGEIKRGKKIEVLEP
ncbi:hypothetical protein ACHAWU_000963 [Discostella pseudostelligera]|uniref:protein-synthesizing GTPase n=1 Tax=Discostella pseudostelligera TaxID=259834 RepID=A0ABD3N9I2_9STRA